MITRWAYRFLANVITLGKAQNILDEKGIERKFEPDMLIRSYSLIKKAKIGLSSGSEAIDQYNLLEPYSETTNIKVSYDELDGKPIITIKATFSVDEDVTIYEVGLFGVFRDNYFMVERTVFRDGISLVAGQTLEITWTFKLS